MKCQICQRRNATVNAIIDGQRTTVNVCVICRDLFHDDTIAITTQPQRIKLIVENMTAHMGE